MPLTIRFPTGASFTYNSAYFLERSTAAWSLYTDEDPHKRKWIASVDPRSGAIVETTPPCTEANPDIDLVKLALEVRAKKRTR